MRPVLYRVSLLNHFDCCSCRSTSEVHLSLPAHWANMAKVYQCMPVAYDGAMWPKSHPAAFESRGPNKQPPFTAGSNEGSPFGRSPELGAQPCESEARVRDLHLITTSPRSGHPALFCFSSQRASSEDKATRSFSKRISVN